MLTARMNLESVMPTEKARRKRLVVAMWKCGPSVAASDFSRDIDSLEGFVFRLLVLFFGGGRPCHLAGGILVPRPGIKPVPPALALWGLNHQTAKEVPTGVFFFN